MRGIKFHPFNSIQYPIMIPCVWRFRNNSRIFAFITKSKRKIVKREIQQHCRLSVHLCFKHILYFPNYLLLLFPFWGLRFFCGAGRCDNYWILWFIIISTIKTKTKEPTDRESKLGTWKYVLSTMYLFLYNRSRQIHIWNIFIFYSIKYSDIWLSILSIIFSRYWPPKSIFSRLTYCRQRVYVICVDE